MDSLSWSRNRHKLHIIYRYAKALLTWLPSAIWAGAMSLRTPSNCSQILFGNSYSPIQKKRWTFPRSKASKTQSQVPRTRVNLNRHWNGTSIASSDSPGWRYHLHTIKKCWNDIRRLGKEIQPSLVKDSVGRIYGAKDSEEIFPSFSGYTTDGGENYTFRLSRFCFTIK